MFQICCKYVSNMFQTCFKYVSNMFQTWCAAIHLLNASCRTCHQVVHVNESCHIYTQKSPIYTQKSPIYTESCHTSDGAHVFRLWRSLYTVKRALFTLKRALYTPSHVTHLVEHLQLFAAMHSLNGSCRTCRRVMSHLQTSHVTRQIRADLFAAIYGRVTSHM